MKPEEGSRYVWNHDTRGAVNVVVTNVTSGGVMVKITETNIIEESVHIAKKTYEDNGNDRDNVKEVCPFIKFEENEIVPEKKHFIVTAGKCNKFEKNFEPK